MPLGLYCIEFICINKKIDKISKGSQFHLGSISKIFLFEFHVDCFKYTQILLCSSLQMIEVSKQKVGQWIYLAAKTINLQHQQFP